MKRSDNGLWRLLVSMFYVRINFSWIDGWTKDKDPFPGVLGKVSPMLYFLLLHSPEQTFYKNIRSQDYIYDTEYTSNVHTSWVTCALIQKLNNCSSICVKNLCPSIKINNRCIFETHFFWDAHLCQHIDDLLVVILMNDSTTTENASYIQCSYVPEWGITSWVTCGLI